MISLSLSLSLFVGVRAKLVYTENFGYILDGQIIYDFKKIDFSTSNFKVICYINSFITMAVDCFFPDLV